MNKKGFTLVEMIVAVAIFSIVSVMISELFIITSRAQQKAGSMQQVQSDARVMMNQIADRIRYGTIDYDAYGASIVSPVDYLYLVDENAREVIIQKSDINFSNTACPSEESTPCLEISEDGGLTYSSMTSENFKVLSVQFYIDPPVTPENDGPDVQPRVTFVFGIESVSKDPARRASAYLQTTVSSRVYLKGSSSPAAPASPAPPASDCGNGITDAGEECDDGNTVGGDGCSAICIIE